LRESDRKQAHASKSKENGKARNSKRIQREITEKQEDLKRKQVKASKRGESKREEHKLMEKRGKSIEIVTECGNPRKMGSNGNYKREKASKKKQSEMIERGGKVMERQWQWICKRKGGKEMKAKKDRDHEGNQETVRNRQDGGKKGGKAKICERK
jgi:hypothetical protein